MLRATKNFKIFSAWTLGPQVCSIILVWHYHLLLKIYMGPYVENGRFLSFQISAGVLVQPWNRIFTSKFEVLLICLKIRYPPRNLRNYVYFENIQKFWWKFWKFFKFWEFSIFFFFENSCWIPRLIWIVFLICQNPFEFLCATCPNIKIFFGNNFLMHKASNYCLVLIVAHILTFMKRVGLI